MFGSLLIFAREGLEGTLVCSILLTYLAAAGRRDLFRYVFGGAGLAVVIATATGVVLWVMTSDAFIGSSQQRWFETGIFAVAVSVLTYMTFWMRRHSRTLGRELREKVSGAVSGGSGIALGVIAFVTVGREAGRDGDLPARDRVPELAAAAGAGRGGGAGESRSA